jgi:hypothetical protein
MFEKEAEEYAEKVYGLEGSLCTNIQEQACAIGFRAGGGYVYNKVNEWHYVKDGDLPKDEKDVQVLYQDFDKVNLYTCLYDIHGECWLYYNLDECLLESFDYKVIAWKEIVLPKEE